MPRTNPETLFVELNRALAPTPGSSDFNTRLTAAGHKHANLGQGSEKTPLTAAAKRLVWAHRYAALENKQTEEDLDRELDGEMNYNTNGNAKLEDAISGWSERNLGFGGHPKTTCAARQVGRGLIKDIAHDWIAFRRAQYGSHNRPLALVPANSWALTISTLKKAGYEILEYPVDPDDVVGSYSRALDEAKQKHRVVSLSYFNFPHNATGAHLRREENIRLKALADKYNKENKYKMMMLYDMPYFAACKKSKEGSGYLDTGMEDVFDKNDFDPSSPDEVVTPIAICLSGSKFFRTARRGFSWVHVTKDLAPSLRTALNESGNGPCWDPEFYESMTNALQPEYDSLWHEQFDLDRVKFEENYEFLCETFGEDLVKGGPNLVALVKLKNVFNKAVKCHDGVVRNIGMPGSQSSRQDILEILANGTPDEDGVLLVDGDTTWEGEDLLRIALAKPPEEFRKDVERMARIAKYIKDSPDMGLAP